jgi:hypothetical protein
VFAPVVGAVEPGALEYNLGYGIDPDKPASTLLVMGRMRLFKAMLNLNFFSAFLTSETI